MSYTQSLIVNLLQTFIKEKVAEASNHYLQIIPHQKFDGDILKEAMKKREQGTICYLLESEETVYHALIITYENNKIKCNYVYVNDAPLSLEILLRSLKVACNTPVLSTTPLKLDTPSKGVGFTEALYQLLTQDKVTTLNIKNSILNHHKICEKVAAVQLDKFKDEFPQLEQLIRLLYLYSVLTTLIKTKELTLQQYFKEKSRCYKTKYERINIYLTFLAYEILFAMANADSAQTLLTYLNGKCQEYLKIMLQAEQIKFPKATVSQKLIKSLQVFYYTSPINIYGELAVQLPNLIERLISNNSFLTNKTVVKKITVGNLLKTIGMMTGSYFLINSGSYYIAKPLITYYSCENLANYLHSERFNDETGDVAGPYLNYLFDADNWYLLVSNLLLLLEAFCSGDAREPVYVGLAIAFNLFFTLSAQRYLPDAPAERMTLLMVISLFSRLLTKTAVGYAYEVSDNQAACDAAGKQFEEAIEGQTVALETSCSSAWMPNFFTADRKLNVLATNKKGDTYELECDICDNGLQKVSNCNVTQEYGKLLK